MLNWPENNWGELGSEHVGKISEKDHELVGLDLGYWENGGSLDYTN